MTVGSLHSRSRGKLSSRMRYILPTSDMIISVCLFPEGGENDLVPGEFKVGMGFSTRVAQPGKRSL